MSSPILITGALGNVGAEVVKRLQAAGRLIRAADLDPAEVRGKFGEAVQAIRFHFSQKETFADTFAGVEKMFLMRPPQISNVQQDMFPALEAAKAAGVKHVVFLSLIGVENAKYVPHYRLEQYLKACGMSTTFLRCSFFMQNLNTVHQKEIKERSEIFVPVGKAKTSFVDVRDVGEVAAIALMNEMHAGRNYDVTGTEALDYWQAAEILSSALGRKITYRNPSPLYFLFKTIRRGAPLPFAVVMTGLYLSTRYGMAERVTDEVKTITGHLPISFAQYAGDYADYWR